MLAPSVTRRLIEHYAGRPVAAPAATAALDQLTEREREIVAWVATGRSNDEIAQELVVSPATVRTHVSRAMTKLHARDRAQLVVFAVQAGLEPPR
jgi:DNA-binding NarL/FixJ family response regulator